MGEGSKATDFNYYAQSRRQGINMKNSHSCLFRYPRRSTMLIGCWSSTMQGYTIMEVNNNKHIHEQNKTAMYLYIQAGIIINTNGEDKVLKL
eukprot:5224337-Ditylum_brightwellii.AAC.1